MSIKERLILAGVAVAIALAVYFFMWRPRQDERAAEKVGAGAELVKEATPVLAKAETLFVHDTVRLTRDLVYHDTVFKRLDIHDTVSVKEYVASSESTIKACTETVSDCSAARAALKKINEGLTLELEGERARRPGRIRQLLDHVTWAGVGYGGCRIEAAVRGR